MPFKYISFVVFILFILSCGSSKQINVIPAKETIQTEDLNIETNPEVEETEITETESNNGLTTLSLQELYNMLDGAVADEDYEKAARLRDEISNREDKK